MTTSIEKDEALGAARASAHSEMKVYRVVGHLPDDLAGDRTTIFDMFDVLRANLKEIASISGAFTLVAISYALLATPIYRSELLLAPADEKSLQSTLLGQLSGLASLAGVSVGGAGNLEAIAILRSRDFTRAFIDDHDLMPVLFEKKWDDERQRWKPTNPDDWPDIRDGVKYFDKSIRTVREDRASGLVTLTIDWKDSQIAANWANILVDRLNAHMRERTLKEAATNIEYLRTELADANVVTLQQSIGRLLEGELQKFMLAKGSEEFVYRIIDRAEPAKRRSKPKRVVITVLGLVFGSMFAIMFVLVRDGFRRRSTLPGEQELV